MITTIKIKNNYNKRTNLFGGIIYPSDFETCIRKTISDIGNRILVDAKFDTECKNKIKNNRKMRKMSDEEY